MQCKHDLNRDRSIQMGPPIWFDPGWVIKRHTDKQIKRDRDRKTDRQTNRPRQIYYLGSSMTAWELNNWWERERKREREREIPYFWDRISRRYRKLCSHSKRVMHLSLSLSLSLILLINNCGTVSTMCVNGCAGSNQVELGRSRLDQSVV